MSSGCFAPCLLRSVNQTTLPDYWSGGTYEQVVITSIALDGKLLVLGSDMSQKVRIHCSTCLKPGDMIAYR